MAKYIIMDFGYNPELTNSQTGETITLERYGVWACNGNVVTDIIEVSNNVEYLKNKYEVNDVVLLKNGSNSRLKKNQ